MSDFIYEFEKRYSKCKKHGMVLPDAVLSFKLLDSCDFSTNERKLALTATSDLKYENMKSALTRIFGNEGQGQSSKKEDGILIKPKEEALYTKDRPSYQRYDKKPFRNFGNRNGNNSTGGKSSVNQLIGMSYGSGVIDTACTKTVTGKRWLTNFLGKLNEEERSAVKKEPSRKGFRFGDGLQVSSFEKVTIPAKIGDVKCNIETEVVNTDIPLLLSKDSLKKAETILDLVNDKAEMFGQSVNLEFTSSGHYCVNILDNSCEDVLVVDSIGLQSQDEMRKTINKLHLQFGHATVERLTTLLKNSGQIKENVIDVLKSVVAKCDVCARYKRPTPRPVVGLPLGTLEGTTSSQIVGDHNSTLIAARKAFIAAESSEKIRRAIRKQIRTTEGPFVTGDKIYYKRPDATEWKGPGTVIGQDGAVVFVRHGGIMVRVHQSQLRRTSEAEIPVIEKTSDDTEVDVNKNVQMDSDEEVEPTNESSVDQESIPDTNTLNLSRIRTGQTLQYKNQESDESMTAKVLSRAGKVSGKNKHWYNLEFSKPVELMSMKQSVDLSKVVDLKINDDIDSEENVMPSCGIQYPVLFVYSADCKQYLIIQANNR
ncbi:hypothetical protein LOTGIDRAFT_153154 [Lottia gigantea]|uniref:Uncharacterized protein n=1 Tax=Lottia gigantea TaxID=225164 RepID=V4BX92_LOTGI|nr:hypothetical protein LOTGIDRAFT_153154 [Lottia gigantea]ESO93699.1 hypothetical protein LOTGIDRAFT_153154 [Lottia gigantea]